MDFCPTCGNLLLLQNATLSRQLQYYCPTCPYIFPIDKKVTKKSSLQQKEVDDVLGGEEAWKNVDRTQIVCPRCTHDYAYFMQVQIRSADEPMTIFYKCCNNDCSYQWRDG